MSASFRSFAALFRILCGIITSGGMAKDIRAGFRATVFRWQSRIILISDTIDAMTTDRPYRKRLGLEIVVAELQKCKGTQFDPAIVEVAVGSVAVSRLIAGASPDVFELDRVTRSRRVSWPGQSLWKIRGA